MIKIIGHGLLEAYGSEVSIDQRITLSELISRLNIPDDLKEAFIAVRDSQVIYMNDFIECDDVIHLYILMCGG